MAIKQFSILAASAAILAGCAQPPITYYSAPEGAPTANLSNDILGAFGRYDMIAVDIADEGTKSAGYWRALFTIKQGKSSQTGPVKVPANVPLELHYFENASGDRTCSVDIRVTLEAGKDYALTGGFLYEKGPIPILTDTRKCQFGVLDRETKQPIRIQRL